MAKGFDRLHVKSAVSSRSKINLDSTHLTTLNFGQIVPIHNLECIPGDKISVNNSIFSRVAPLVVPTYGKANLKTLSAFVPYHQIAEDAEAYLAGQKSYMGQTPVLRHFTLGTIFTLFQDSSYSSSGSTDSYDFCYLVNTTKNYRKFTPQGKYVYKIMRSLGYQIPESINTKSDSYWSTTLSKIKLNAMPLLCFFKAYNDWMSRSVFYNSSFLSYALLNIRQNKGFTDHGTYSNTGEISAALLKVMFSEVKLCYDNDYFVSAWKTPNQPINEQNIDSIPIPSLVAEDPFDTYYDHVGSSTRSTYLYNVDTAVGNARFVSATALRFLNAFDSWVRRNNYAGCRDVEKIYARFGIKSDEFKSHYAHVLNSSSYPLQVGDVTATSDSGNYDLGGFAGKGIINGNSSFNFTADDFGHLITLCWIAVRPLYPDGFARQTLRNSPLDFFNPEFDSVGVQPISVMEVAEYGNQFPDSNAQTGDDIYGFTERHNDYRFSRDLVTGDMAVTKYFDAWHFGRNLSNYRKTGNIIAQTDQFTMIPPTSPEYDRIFQITDNNEDKFYLSCNFGVNAVRPMKDLSGVTNLGDGNLDIARNGNQAS